MTIRRLGFCLCMSHNAEDLQAPDLVLRPQYLFSKVQQQCKFQKHPPCIYRFQWFPADSSKRFAQNPVWYPWESAWTSLSCEFKIRVTETRCMWTSPSLVGCIEHQVILIHPSRSVLHHHTYTSRLETQPNSINLVGCSQWIISTVYHFTIINHLETFAVPIS